MNSEPGKLSMLHIMQEEQESTAGLTAKNTITAEDSKISPSKKQENMSKKFRKEQKHTKSFISKKQKPLQML